MLIMNMHLDGLVKNDHITVAKWLYSLGEVNIHADNEYAFRWSCKMDRLTVAKWLYSLGEGMDRTDPSSPARKGQGYVDIHADNEYAFRFSIGNTLKWLKKLIC